MLARFKVCSVIKGSCFQHRLLSVFVVLLLCFSLTPSAAERPNIMLIIADDLGYADLGYMGSRISTPNIDSLAAGGLAFGRFHAAPMCAPTRAMLFSGNNNHVAGMGRQHPKPLLRDNMPGFEERLSARVMPFPRLLKAANYRTYISGKWHLGNSTDSSPVTAGFDRSFVLTNGAATHWDTVGFTEEGSTYREDGLVTDYPTGRYSSDLFTSRLIEYLEADSSADTPFFAVAAYTSPHWPLQVPEADLDLYAGEFDEGYDRLRDTNVRVLRELGYFPAVTPPPFRSDEYPLWDELSAVTQRKESRKMELYAAMVHNLDRHVGRLLDYLKDKGLFDNTLVIFMSDNGAAPADFYNEGPYQAFVRRHYDNALPNMGRPSSFVSYGPAWAEAGTALFRGYKRHTAQGGLVSPMVMTGPMIERTGMTLEFTTVADLAPTLLHLAGVAYPQSDALQPMIGTSMLPFLTKRAESVHPDNYESVMFHRGYGMARKGRWKILSFERPFDESGLRLYDVVSDPGETQDLRHDQPGVFAEMLELWRRKRLQYGVILPEDL